jgi:large subunit ribosomal protein L31
VAGDPAATRRGLHVRTGIHPDYVATTVSCSCGNTFETHSTKKSGAIHVEVCSNCHPFYTGKQKIMDAGGRVARFEKRYGRRDKTAAK